jgi:hypothetical protein
MQSTPARHAASPAASYSQPLRAVHIRFLICVALASFATVPLTLRAQLVPALSPAPSLGLDPLPGQPRMATVTFGPGKVVSAPRHKIAFQQVGVLPLQVVDIMLQYPVGFAGRVVMAEPLDGGRVITGGQPLTIGNDGSLGLRYEVGALPGLYQVLIHYDEQAAALQFWVFDADHPENNPDVLTPL